MYKIVGRIEPFTRGTIIKFKVLPLIARCAPDWHSEHMSKSYVGWILIFGFTFPAVVIAIATIATCFNIQQVSKNKKLMIL